MSQAKVMSAHPAFPWGVLGVTISALLVQTLAVHFTYPYTSDDIGLANIISLWLGGQHATTWLPENTYFLRIPIYLLFDALNLPPRHTLLLLYSTVILFGFSILFVALRSFAREQALSHATYLVPFFYIATLGGPFFLYTKVLNGRNIEPGLALLLLAPLSANLKGVTQRGSRWVLLWFPVAMGLLLYSDPYYLFTLFLPLLILVLPAAWVTCDRRSAARITGALTLGIVFYQLLRTLLPHVGVVNGGAGTAPEVFVTFKEFGPNLVRLLRGLLEVFHANFFGQPIRSLSTLTMLGGALVMMATLGYSLWRIGRIFRHRSFRDELWALSVCLVPWSVGAAYVMQPAFSSDWVVDPTFAIRPVFPGDLFRYLTFIPFVSIFIMALLLNDISNRRLRRSFCGFLLVLSMMHLIEPLQQLKDGDLQPNATQEAAVQSLASEDMSKGYADYWDANISTYFSGQRINVIQSTCGSGGKVVAMRWNMDDIVLSEPARRSFLMVNKNSLFLAPCQSTTQLEQQFGPPRGRIQVDARISINVYDYDIGQRFGPSGGWAK